MPKQKNIDVVASLKEKLNRAKSVVLTDYRGLTHKQLEELHRNLKKIEAEYIVVKNSLLKIASQDTRYKIQDTSEIAGPSAILLSYQDEIAPLKALAKTIKSLTLPKIKFGFIGKTRYSDTEIDTISKLPGQEELRGQVVSGLASPMTSLVYSLNYNVQKLVYVLDQVKSSS